MSDSEPVGAGSPASSTTACAAALALAVRLLETASVDVSDHRLTSIENLIGHAGGDAWRLTFRLLRQVLAAPDSMITAGGEIFVQVDVRLGRIVSVTYGE